MRQLTQQTEVFIRTSCDADHDICRLAFAPGNPLRKLENLHTGIKHQITGICGAMRDCDAVAKVSRGLQLTRQHAVYITCADATGLSQCCCNLANSVLLIAGSRTEMNILL
ncbi:hypothetical protein SRABI106_04151 [Rahnella aquatilis]|nr:hypothetical protein SRABI106_04151 [Rahnella aquatilis]